MLTEYIQEGRRRRKEKRAQQEELRQNQLDEQRRLEEARAQLEERRLAEQRRFDEERAKREDERRRAEAEERKRAEEVREQREERRLEERRRLDEERHRAELQERREAAQEQQNLLLQLMGQMATLVRPHEPTVRAPSSPSRALEQTLSVVSPIRTEVLPSREPTAQTSSEQQPATSSTSKSATPRVAVGEARVASPQLPLSQTAPLSTSIDGTHTLPHCVPQVPVTGGAQSLTDSANLQRATPPVRSLPSHLPPGALALPERFNDAHKKNIDAWFACVEFWCEKHGVDPSDRVDTAVSLLDVTNLAKARAARIVDTKNFTEFKTQFKSILGCNESKSALSARLMNLAQRGDETAPAFGARVLELVIAAYPELEFPVAQRLAQGFFTSGLVDDDARKDIRLRSLAFGPAGPTWDQLMEAANTFETERAVGHSYSQAAALRDGPSSQSFTRSKKDEHRRSRSRDSGQGQRAPLANPQPAPPQYPSGPPGPPWFPPPYWQYPLPTQPPQFPPLGQSADTSKRGGHGNGRGRGRGGGSRRGRSESATGPRNTQPQRAQSIPSAKQVGRDAAPANAPSAELGNVVLEHFPKRLLRKREQVHAVGDGQNLGAKREHRALILVDVNFEDVFDVKALIDTGAGRTLVERRLYNQFLAVCFAKRHPPPQIMNWSNPNCLTGVGGSIAPSQFFSPEMYFLGVSIRHPILICEGLPSPFIIGMDVLRLHKMVLSLSTRVPVTLFSDDCYVCSANRAADTREEMSCYRVHPDRPGVENTRALGALAEEPSLEDPSDIEMPRECVLPARSGQLAELTAPSDFEDGVLLLVESPETSDSPAFVLPTVAEVKHGKVNVVVLNRDAEHERTLQVGDVRFSPIDQTQPPPAAEPCVPVSDVELQTTRERVDDILEKVCPSATRIQPETRRGLRDLVEEYIDVFSTGDNDLGLTNRVYHEIDVGDARPICQHPRRIPYGEKRDEVANQTRELCEIGVVRKSNSPWASPVVIVKKKDGTWRMCIDYRKINGVTKRDAFPLLRIDDALDALSGSTTYCTMDLAKGYYQIPVNPKDIEKTAFVTHEGLFEFLTMPFGLCNAPATFQRLMFGVLEGLLGKECLSYIDDILVFGRSELECLARLRRVLDRLRQAKLKVKPSKCKFFRREVTFLGHEVSAAGVRPDREKVRVVREWAVPTKVKTLQGFLGLVNYFSRHIENYAQIAAPLYEKTRAGSGETRITLDAVELKHFERLKNALAELPLLSHPRLDEPFTLQTDASKMAIGSVLLQRQPDGLERPIAFFSKKLDAAQQNYSTYKRECLAVVRAVHHFRVYLQACEFEVKTDHYALKWLFSHDPEDGILGRWITELQCYKFKIIHIPGKQNCVADALSRLPESVEFVGTLDDVVIDDHDLPNEIQSFAAFQSGGRDWTALQAADPLLSRLRAAVKKSEQPDEDDEDLAPYRSCFAQLALRDNLLVRNFSFGPVIVVPPSEVESFSRELHKIAHAAADRTLNFAEQRFWWPTMRFDIESVTQNCEVCDLERSPNPALRAAPGRLPVGRPFEVIYIDLVGGKKALERDGVASYLLTIIDSFTGWAEAVPLPDMTTETVVNALVERWIAIYGVPERIHTDQGTQFESRLFQSLCAALHIEKSRTTPYHPQGNGKIERFNKSICTLLRKLVLERGDASNWQTLLPRALMAYRTMLSSTTGFTPFKLVFGREMRTGVDFATPFADASLAPKDHLLSIISELEELHECAREVMDAKFERSAHRLSAKAVRKFFRPGDMVRIRNHTMALTAPTKFAPR